MHTALSRESLPVWLSMFHESAYVIVVSHTPYFTYIVQPMSFHQLFSSICAAGVPDNQSIWTMLLLDHDDRM